MKVPGSRNASVIIIFLTVIILNSCYLINTFRWQNADMHDYKKFHSLKINKSDSVFHFKYGKMITLSDIELPHKFKYFNNLNDLIIKTKTLSFLIIKNDSIIFEKYYNNNGDYAYYPSFSVSKSFISALIGIAIDEGYIKSTEQPITDFIKDFKNKRFNKVTIGHLLNMKSGIEFDENYSNPLSDIVKYYYGPNLQRYIKHLNIKEEPGIRYEYISVNTLLLSMILEKATGYKTSDYLMQKIWMPLGMEYDATWSVDSKRNRTVKSFCCLNSHTRDYARFGRLFLKKGNWNGKQIISEKWIESSLAYSKDSTADYYLNYHWRVGRNGDFFAKGALGQYIYIYPKKSIIIVRTANEYGIEDWENVFRYISIKL